MVTITQLKKKAQKKQIPLYTTFNKEELEDALSDRKFSLGWRLTYIKPIVYSQSEYRNIVYKLFDSVRDISSNRKVQNFLKKHKVYITMTTSPLRLPKICAVLATLDLEYVDKIFVVLPFKYGRKKETYSRKDSYSCEVLESTFRYCILVPKPAADRQIGAISHRN